MTKQNTQRISGLAAINADVIRKAETADASQNREKLANGITGAGRDAAMNKPAHSKLPWENPGTDGGEYVICYTDEHGKRRTVAHVYSEANAALVVEACNNYEAVKLQHDELLAAIHDAVAKMDVRVCNASKGKSIAKLSKSLWPQSLK